MRETETELDDIEEQICAAQYVVDRVEVRSPVHGVRVKKNFHTPGGVVAPGAVILELLPIGDERIIEAHVNPKPFLHVRVGEQALVRLSALNQRVTPMVGGSDFYVSADALPEQVLPGNETRPDIDRHREFYVVRVRLDQDDTLRRIPEFIPTPGMPADLYIKTGERTVFRVHYEAGIRQLLPRFPRNLNGRLVANAGHSGDTCKRRVWLGLSSELLRCDTQSCVCLLLVLASTKSPFPGSSSVARRSVRSRSPVAW